MEIKQPVMFTRDISSSDDIVEFPSHIMQYTNTRPVIKYCENLKNASLHLISRAQLMDTVPDDISPLLTSFWNSIRCKRLVKLYSLR